MKKLFVLLLAMVVMTTMSFGAIPQDKKADKGADKTEAKDKKKADDKTDAKDKKKGGKKKGGKKKGEDKKPA